MKLKVDFKKMIQDEKIRFSLMLFVLAILTYLVSKADSPEPQVQNEEIVQLDALIPEGFVLLPLDLVNREAISSIVGSTAVIDLFTVNAQTLNPSKKIATRIKIIRTPRNPDQFALLVQENETPQILNYTGPYFAVIQNKATQGSKLVPKKQSQDIQISYQE